MCNIGALGVINQSLKNCGIFFFWSLLCPNLLKVWSNKWCKWQNISFLNINLLSLFCFFVNGDCLWRLDFCGVSWIFRFGRCSHNFDFLCTIILNRLTQETLKFNHFRFVVFIVIVFEAVFVNTWHIQCGKIWLHLGIDAHFNV